MQLWEREEKENFAHPFFLVVRSVLEKGNIVNYLSRVITEALFLHCCKFGYDKSIQKFWPVRFALLSIATSSGIK